jgi:hypothetical protein
MAELFAESALFGDRTAAGENGDWGMYRRGVRADCGRVKGDGGGMVMVCVLILVGGADIGGSSFAGSQRLQLLDLEVAGDSLSAGPEVDVNELLEAVDVIEVGRPSKTNLVLVPVDIGLMKAGDRVLRKSR